LHPNHPATTFSSLFFFFFYCYADHRDLHSFPTRRSSDLGGVGKRRRAISAESCATEASTSRRAAVNSLATRCFAATTSSEALVRSEEHTSELQSQSNLVCRLLLEKKKKKKRNNHIQKIEN